ncbi:MAG: KpsF/GutQ family sugar-phosphate isomerase [Candidatus Binatia bacterium]
MRARTKRRSAAAVGGESVALTRARRVIEAEAQAVAALVERLDESFERAIEILALTPGKVVVTGLGKSGIIARKVAATFASTGTPAFFLHAGEGVHGDLGMVVRGDTVIMISKDGETRELLGMFPVLKRMALPVIAVTGSPGSSLAKRAEVVLDVSVREEACPLALAPTTSTTAALAMGDALAIVLMERRGFQEKDFALIHPGGTLGRQLLRVEDLMHRGDGLPLVDDRSRVREAITEMTAKRLGCTGVVDPQGRLAGVVTDGDLRRAFQRGETVETPVRDVMNPSPKTIGRAVPAGEAVAMMERYAITQLFIVDERKRPRGVLHLHDVLKAVV